MIESLIPITFCLFYKFTNKEIFGNGNVSSFSYSNYLLKIAIGQGLENILPGQVMWLNDLRLLHQSHKFNLPAFNNHISGKVWFKVYSNLICQGSMTVMSSPS